MAAGHRLSLPVPVCGRPQLADLLAVGQTARPSRHTVKVSFESPTPEGCLYLGRNNRFVEQLCQLVMANTLARQDKRAARAAVKNRKRVVSFCSIRLRMGGRASIAALTGRPFG